MKLQKKSLIGRMRKRKTRGEGGKAGKKECKNEGKFSFLINLPELSVINLLEELLYLKLKSEVSMEGSGIITLFT